MMSPCFHSRLFYLCVVSTLASATLPAENARVTGKNIRIEFDNSMHSRVVGVFAGQQNVIGDFTPSESIRIEGSDIAEFRLQSQRREAVTDRLGTGYRTTRAGIASSLKKTVVVTVYDAFPRMAFFDVAYTNTGTSDLPVNGWTNQRYAINAPSSAAQPSFWSYQSGSYKNRPDWVLPLSPGSKQENFLGMNATDYGGELRSSMFGAGTRVLPSATSKWLRSWFRCRSQWKGPRARRLLWSLRANGRSNRALL